MLVVVAALVVAALVAGASAQSTTLELRDDGAWVQTRVPEAGSVEARIAEIRRELALGRGASARALAGRLVRDLPQDSPWMAQAVLLLGDATSAVGHEYRALFQYEEIINRFSSSPEYRTAIERELEIAIDYVRGKKRRIFWGLLRIGSADKLGAELLIRVQERLPRSDVAERAGIELADYYFRARDMEAAAEAYELFMINFPESVHRRRAMLRRILANVARFKGPRYDASGLIEGEALIEEFRERFPLEAQETGMSDALLARLDESQGAQLLENARWYLRTGDEVSGRFTLRRLIARHPRSVAAERARELLRERGWSVPGAPSDVPESVEGEAGEGGSAVGGDDPVAPIGDRGSVSGEERSSSERGSMGDGRSSGGGR